MPPHILKLDIQFSPELVRNILGNAVLCHKFIELLQGIFLYLINLLINIFNSFIFALLGIELYF